MHVLILNATFYPDVAATAQHMWDLSQHLTSAGHRVSVITSRNFYGSTKQHAKAFERIGNIDIHRVRGTRFGKGKHLSRLSDFSTYYLAAAWQMQHLANPDVILGLTSPPMVNTLAVLQKTFRRSPSGQPVRFVYYVMDLYPDAAVASGIISENHPTDRCMRRLTARTLDVADHTIALGQDMKDRLIRNYGRHARPDRIAVIPPWADKDELWPIDKSANPLLKQLGLDRTFNVVYSGNLGLPHDVETIADAIEITRDDPTLRWVFIGGGKHLDQLAARATDRAWPNFLRLPYQPREMLNQSLNLADIHLVSQRPPFTGVVLPSKLFGILAVGKPALMIGPPDAEVSRILTIHHAGLVIPNGDAPAVVAAVHRLRDDPTLLADMGANARTAFLAHYDRRVACGKIEALLRDVVAR